LKFEGIKFIKIILKFEGIMSKTKLLYIMKKKFK